ncbi:hypothetical protein ACSBR1_019498 [Camellia fascicularis]
MIIDRFLSWDAPLNNRTHQLVEARRSAFVPDLNLHLTHVQALLDVEKQRGTALDQLTMAAGQCEHHWWEGPIEEMNLPQVHQFKAAMIELRTKTGIRTDRVVHEQPANPFGYWVGQTSFGGGAEGAGFHSGPSSFGGAGFLAGPSSFGSGGGNTATGGSGFFPGLGGGGGFFDGQSSFGGGAGGSSFQAGPSFAGGGVGSPFQAGPSFVGDCGIGALLFGARPGSFGAGGGGSNNNGIVHLMVGFQMPVVRRLLVDLTMALVVVFARSLHGRLILMFFTLYTVFLFPFFVVDDVEPYIRINWYFYVCDSYGRCEFTFNFSDEITNNYFQEAKII